MLGQFLTIALILLLTFITAVLPIARARRVRSRKNVHEAYRKLKLRAVRRSYRALHGMTNEEITQRFNVSEAYDNIGR